MIKQARKKFVAGFLALVMAIGLLPSSAMTNVLAAEVASYSVRLTDGTNVLEDLDGVEVTLTQKDDETNTSTQATVDGVAVFENFVEEGVRYVLSVASEIGYEDVVASDCTIAIGEDTKDVEMTAIDKVTVSGIVTDEQDAVYAGATVNVSGYFTTQVVTDENGTYSFEAYKGKEIMLTFKAKTEDVQYKDGTIQETYNADTSDVNHKFQVKTFDITTGVDDGEKGAITPSMSGVLYGTQKDIVVTANPGYRIAEVKVNDSPRTQARDEQTYTVSIPQVKDDYDIVATFYKKQFSVTFTVGQNGQVIFANGESDAIAGGSIQDVKVDEFGTLTFEAVANTANGYHVESVDGCDTPLADGDNTTTNYPGTVTNVTGDKTIEVEFAINEYEVHLIQAENGSASIATSQVMGNPNLSGVEYGEEVVVTAKPNVGYELEEIEIDGVPVNFEETDIDVYEAEKTITKETEVKVTFEQKVAVPEGAYKMELLSPYGEAEGVTYVAKEGKVKFTALGEYTRVRINGSQEYVGSEVTVTLGDEPNLVSEITSIEVTKKAVAGWSKKKELKITADDIKPVISEVENDGKWFADDGNYLFTASDANSGVKEVKYSDKNNIGSATVIPEIAGKYSFEVNKEYDDKYYIWVVDKCGNTATKEVDVRVDKEVPSITKFDFRHECDDAFSEIVNFLTFGLFCNKKIVVTVEASDAMNNAVAVSGLQSITLYLNNEEPGITKTVEEGKAVFEITSNEDVYSAKVSAVATDKVGHTTAVPVIPTTENSNIISDDTLMIEKVSPSIQVQYADGASAKNPSTADTNDWYDTDVKFDVIVADADSGIRSIWATINDIKVEIADFDKTVYKKDACEYYFYDTKNEIIQFSINTDLILELLDENSLKELLKEGKYAINVHAVDNAGNEIAYSDIIDDEEGIKIFIDRDAPYITGFDFQATDYVEGNETIINPDGQPIEIEETEYGFYFKQDTQVIVSAKDNKGASSGIKSIKVYLHDINNTYYGVNPTTKEIVELVAQTEIEAQQEAEEYLVNAAGTIDFKILADFKGQIYAKATDNVNHVTAEFAYPNSAIVESPKTHGETSSIEITAPATTCTQNEKYHYQYNGNIEGIQQDAVMDYNNEQKVPLYNKDQKFEVVVSDSYSGIRNIKVSIFANGALLEEGQEDTTFANKETEDEVNDWKIQERDSNLITKVAKLIPVDGNYNDMVILIELTDRAGNSSYDYYTFGIDKTNPTIAFACDNNEADSQYTDIYKADRTATITIQERNFRPEDVVIKITNTDGVIPAIGKWSTKEVEEGQNPDLTEHVAEIHYAADGDYTFDISYKDNAGNEAESKHDAFTIDKTLPVVNVAYDNNSARNGNYYKADRTATITITEHNFDASRVKVIGTASDDGKATTFPTASTWSSNGDAHTATIVYNVDSKYTFDIAFNDMAGNSITDYTVEEFYIDKTNPSLSIENIVDKSANNQDGNIGFVVTATDTNFDGVTPVLTAVIFGENGFETKVLNVGQKADIKNGQTYTVSNLETDGVYSITCTLVDKAGNEYQEVTLEDADGKKYIEKRSGNDTLVQFSVNREGSTFVLGDYTEQVLDNYYVQKVTKDITITEINADSITESTVTLNGKTLVEDEDYKVALDGSGGGWHKYTYSIDKTLFDDEGEYNIVVSSKDRATNDAFSDVKGASVKFVVDRTAPVITVTGMAQNGRYQTELQTVTIIPTDDGGALNSLLVRTVDDDGKQIAELINLSGEDLENALLEGNGKLTFPIGEGLYQNIQIICNDCAVDEDGNTNTYDETFTNVSVSSSAVMIFWANKPLRWGAISGVAVVAAAIVGFIIYKKRKGNK